MTHHRTGRTCIHFEPKIGNQKQQGPPVLAVIIQAIELQWDYELEWRNKLAPHRNKNQLLLGSVWKPASLSERIRVLRCGPGHFITSHRDGTYSRDDNECSFLTVIVYLNDREENFIGGTTNFLRQDSAGETDTFIIGPMTPRRGAI